MTPSISVALGVLFVLAGASAIWLILDASARSQDPRVRNRRILGHRIAGYSFVALFCFMGWFMILRTRGWSGELPLPSLFHIVIAMLMAPLLFVKIIIARYYKSYHSILTGLGLSLFTLGFVLVASTAGPYLFRKTTIKNVSLELVHMRPARIDLQASESLMQQRCSRCHALERVIGARKDARGWLVTINRMRALPGSGISERDAETILSYLLSENSIDTSSPQGEITVGKALVDSHCGRCHALDRTYESARSADEWRTLVTRMAGYAQGTQAVFKPGETERIIRFLSLTQTPETLRTDARPAPELAARSAKNIPEGTKNSGAAVPTTTVLLVITAALGVLVFRRPKPSHTPSVEPTKQVGPSLRKPWIVQLVRTERQTHDCVTLRFRLAPDSRFEAKPGQFLTFQWLIKGQRIARSYSISSSPTQTGHFEITVKQQGFISTFLNEQIPDGYTVEAQGPFGQFCFDERTHRKIVLFAGGSGITPIMSMLRYIDDLCLDTDLTLFYSVRSHADIIFERELERLRRRLVKFKVCIILTRPDSNWNGPRGRLTRKLLLDNLTELEDSTNFVCGPEAFMSHVEGLLISLGVEEGKIKQEQFGIQRTSPLAERESALPTCRVEFVRSGRSSEMSSGQTLLEAAEANGILIPFACRQGQCGTCVTRLLEGDVQMATENGLNPDLKAQGYVLTCVAQAHGSVRVDA